MLIIEGFVYSVSDHYKMDPMLIDKSVQMNMAFIRNYRFDRNAGSSYTVANTEAEYTIYASLPVCISQTLPRLNLVDKPPICLKFFCRCLAKFQF